MAEKKSARVAAAARDRARTRVRSLGQNAGAAALALVVASCASREGASVDEIRAGTRSERSGVVAIANPHIVCTGFLLTPSLVMTARHCVGAVVSGGGGCNDQAGELYAAREFRVFTEAELPLGALGGLRVDAVYVEPGSDGGPMCENDVALLRLRAPIEGATTVPLRLDEAPRVGESLTVVGYGQDGADGESTGVRRERSGVQVEALGPSGRLGENEWVVDEGPCFGDSGGPALDTMGRVVGVMSRGQGNVCQHMLYQRVDRHAAWLRAQARTVATELGSTVPAWAEEPAASDAGAGEAGAGDGGGPAVNPMRMGCAVAPRARGRREGAVAVVVLGAALAALVLRRTRRRVGRSGAHEK